MRSGVTLMELLAVSVLVAAVGMVSLPLFQVLVVDIPRVKRAVDAHANLCDALRQVRRDVEEATGVVEADPTRAPPGHLLTVAHGVESVRYRLAAGQVIRERIGRDGRQVGPARTWPAPGALVGCRLLERDGRAVAVVVTTSVEVSQKGRRFKKLANTGVFFIGSCRRGGGTGR